MARFVRVIRGVAGASLVALGFAFVIIVVGTPIALIVRGLHEGLSWLSRVSDHPSALIGALISVSSVAAAVIVTILLTRGLVVYFHWRRRLVAGA